MQRRLNGRFLLCFLGASCAVLIATHWLHGRQVRRNAGVLLEQADRAEANGDLPLALGYLKHYLGLVRGDVEVRARFGRTLNKAANGPKDKFRAYEVLEAIVRQNPERHDVRRDLVRLSMELDRFADAREHLKVLRSAYPGDTELEGLFGVCLEQDGEYPQARESYEAALGMAPDRLESYARLASLLRRRAEEVRLKGVEKTLTDVRAKADGVMDLMVARNGQSAQAYLYRARYRREHHSPEAAAADLAQALKLAADDSEVLLEAAELARDRKKPEDARAFLKRAAELHPADARCYKALAALEIGEGRRPEAAAVLREGLRAVPDGHELRWMLADLLIDQGRLAEAEGEITALGRARTLPELLGYLDARVLLEKGRWLEAVKTLEGVQSRLKNWPELEKRSYVFLGRAYEQLGDWDRQYTACRRAVNLDRLFLPAHLGLGSALETMGKLAAAAEAYDRIPANTPELKLRVKLMKARVQILQNLQLPPARREWREVEDVLAEAGRQLRDSVVVPILRAEVLVAQGQFETANDILLTARDAHPKRIELWVALGELAERRNLPEAALALWDEAGQQLGDRVELRLARARHFARRDTPESARELEKLGAGLEKFPRDERQRLLRGLADGYLRLGRNAEAEAGLHRLLRQQPDLLAIRLLLFDLARQEGRDDKMCAVIEEIRQVEGPGGSLYRYCKASRLIWLGRDGDRKPLDEARLLLNGLAAERPAWSCVPLCEGEVDDLLGNQDLAITNYQKAVDLGERNLFVVRRMVQLLYERRRFVEADQVIRKLPEQTPLLADLQRLAADVSLRSRDYERALTLAQKAVSTNSKDYRDHIWLGHILWVVGRKAEAEPVLRRAVELAGDQPDAWVALVQYHARMGQKDKAEAALAEAKGRFTGPHASLSLAQCYEAVGRMDQARECYQAALAAGPEDIAVLKSVANFFLRIGRLNEAEPHLKKIAAQIKAPRDARWAQQVLVLVLALKGDYQQSREALAVVGILDDTTPEGPPGESVEDQRARALMFAVQRGRKARRNAVRVFEGLNERQPLAPDDLFVLAQLYESLGEWPRARERFVNLVNANDDNRLYLSHYARALVKRKEYGEAQIWLAKLEKLEPDSFRTLDIKSRILKSQGKAGEAVALLRANVEKRPALRRSVAALLEDLGEITAAEEMFRKDVSPAVRPDAVLALARFLGRHGRPAEALDLCETAGKTCPPEAVAAACVEVVYQPKAREDERQRVARWLEGAIRQNPDKAAQLGLHLGSLRNLQGRYQEAESLFRQVIERDAGNALALNNLAWLTALRDRKGAEAAGLIDRAIARAGPLPGLLDTRGVVYLSTGRGEEALRDLEESAAELPRPATFFHLAQAHLLAGDRKSAAQALQKARGLDLKENDLHPLERSAYEQLLAAVR